MPNSIVHARSGLAAEGWPLVIAGLLLTGLCWWFGWQTAALSLAVFSFGLICLFRDPGRVVPPLPAAVYAPVDGRVLAAEQVQGAAGAAEWWHVRIRVSRLGAYTVRAPIEGTVKTIPKGLVPSAPGGGLRLCSEEGDEVLLAFRRRGPLLTPRTFIRFGERLGQGHRFAYLRLAPVADIYFPASARLKVAAGERVRAGDTVLAELIARAEPPPPDA